MQGSSPFTCPRSLALAQPAARGLWLPGFVLALLAAGCTNGHILHDPLRGEGPEIPSKTTAPPPPAAVVAGPSASDPKAKIPPESTSKGPSLAALTMRGTPGPESDHPPVASPAVLQPPVTHNVPSNAHIVPISTMSENSYEDLQNQLKSLGVTEQSLRKLPNSDQWSFVCRIPVPNGKGIQRRYEGTAGGDNGLAVIKAVLADIKMHPP
jgi:hypothetical protein